MVPLAEIADPKNDFNLNLPRYIDSTEPEDLQDIDGHLRGGIPERDIDALGAYWKVLPGVRAALFETAGRPGYARLEAAASPRSSPPSSATPSSPPSSRRRPKLFANWQKASTPRLTGFGKDGHPKALIETIAEDLLATFQPGAAARRLRRLSAPHGLLGRDHAGRLLPDRRRRLGEGRAAARDPFRSRTRTTSSSGPSRTTTRRASGASSPTSFPRRFSSPATSPPSAMPSTRSTTELAALEQQLDEMREEQQRRGRAARRGDRGRGRQAEDHRQGREGAAQGDRQGPGLRRRARGARRLRRRCWSSRPTPRPSVKAAQEDLDDKLDAKYPKLTEDEIKTLVVDDKWMATPGGRRAGRAGPRLADPHRPHPPAGRTLRHAAAAAHRRSGDARRPRGRSTSRRWGRYGSEARLQADRGGRHSGGVGVSSRLATSAISQRIATASCNAAHATGTAIPYRSRSQTIDERHRSTAMICSRCSQTIEHVCSSSTSATATVHRSSERATVGDWSAAAMSGATSSSANQPALRSTLQMTSRISVYARSHFESMRSAADAQAQGASTANLHANFGAVRARRLPATSPNNAPSRTALSDVDALLGGLDRLIAKKRDLKQAAMQQLLTGQTRLPGFHGEWEVKRLARFDCKFRGRQRLSTLISGRCRRTNIRCCNVDIEH